MKPRIKTKTIVMLGMLCAMAYALVFVSSRMPPIVPAPPLKYDPKDIIIVIGGFLYGPLASAAVSLVVSFIEMITFSTTGPIGFVMNVLSSCSFACFAAFVYRRKRSLSGAVIGLITGCLTMTSVMLLWNYLIVPLYLVYVSREAVAKMLVPTFLPFNLLKSGINAAATMLVYKPLTAALRRVGLLGQLRGDLTAGADVSAGSDKKSGINAGVYIVSALALITLILLVLVFAGVI